jgi:hypothetical protein
MLSICGQFRNKITFIPLLNGHMLTPKIGAGKRLTCGLKFGKEMPFSRKFSSKHSVKVPAVGSTPSFGRTAVLRLEEGAFGNK